MNNAVTHNEAHLRSAFIMNRILKVQYSDTITENELCKELLGIAQPETDPYAYAFANVYLFDSILALEDYEECVFYLNRASYVCRKYKFDDLMVKLCNLAGLYYSKLNEAQISVQYYLEGLSLVRALHDHETQSKLFNNIGVVFAARGDWDTAKNYFLQAYNTIEKYVSKENFGVAISFLCNLSEAYQNVDMLEDSEQALKKCDAIDTRASRYHSIRLACAWSTHYAAAKDINLCIDFQERAVEYGLLTYENSYFASDMCIGMFEIMMNINEYGRARIFMKALADLQDEAAVVVKHRYLRLTIRYWEACSDIQQQNKAYRDYYYTARKIAKIDSKAQALSLYGYVQAANAHKERERMFKGNRELELASQLDELTGLYNRRYFLKLESKVTQRSDVHSLGYIMLDIDYFKQFNDFYGHFQGDAALKAVAGVLRRISSGDVYAGRYGGDEFVCLLVNFTDEQMQELATTIVNAISNEQIPHERSKCSKYLSASLGLCNSALSAGIQPKELLMLADKALYKTKVAGKNGYTQICP